MGDVRFNKVDTLQYIEDMLRNMKTMAKSTDSQVLVYLLEMAALESREQIKAYQEELQSMSE